MCCSSMSVLCAMQNTFSHIFILLLKMYTHQNTLSHSHALPLTHTSAKMHTHTQIHIYSRTHIITQFHIRTNIKSKQHLLVYASYLKKKKKELKKTSPLLIKLKCIFHIRCIDQNKPEKRERTNPNLVIIYPLFDSQLFADKSVAENTNRICNLCVYVKRAQESCFVCDHQIEFHFIVSFLLPLLLLLLLSVSMCLTVLRYL